MSFRLDRWAKPVQHWDMTRNLRLPPGRTLFCLDVENLHGNPFFCSSQAEAIVDAVRALVPAEGGAHVVVAASSAGGCVEAGIACPAARCTWEPGTDGADRALLEILRSESIAERFAHVVIGSGDGVFAEIVRALRMSGVLVTVVSRRGSLSTKLAQTANRVLFLPTDESNEDGGTAA